MGPTPAAAPVPRGMPSPLAEAQPLHKAARRHVPSSRSPQSLPARGTVRLRRENVLSSPPLLGGLAGHGRRFHRLFAIPPSRRDTPEGSPALRGAPLTTGQPARRRPPPARRDKAPSGQGVARGPCARQSRPVAWRRWAAFHWAALGAVRVHAAPVTYGAALKRNARVREPPLRGCSFGRMEWRQGRKKAPSRAARSPSAFYRVPKMRSPASPRPGMM